jgi:hypothetical protein
MSKRKHPLSEKAILKIPKSDFPSLTQTQSPNIGPTESNILSDSSSSPAVPPPLLLLQLPTNLTVRDLANSHFAFDPHDEMKCWRLISVDKGITYDLVKVSTSNSYVLVPPDEKNQDANNNSNEASPMVSHDTKSTMQNKNPLACVQARLLRETDTFFIECTESKTDLDAEIDKILQEFVYPTKGISIDQISERLMCSKKQVTIVLDKLKAFQVSSGKSQPTYGLLSEEMEREVWFVIRSVLSEWDGGSDYAGKGVLLQDMVEEILRRNDGSEGDLEEGVVRCCLDKCILDIDNGLARLDADYVSTVVLLFYINA